MNRQPNPEKIDVAGLSDADCERILRDAYPVPPIPQGLVTRIDRDIATLWGDKPQVANRNGSNQPMGARPGMKRMTRSWRTWPVAAGVALAIVLTLTLRNDAQAYSWASVVEAISKQIVVRLGSTGTSESEGSWLSISQRKLGVRSGSVDRLYDLAQGVLLERRAAEFQATRFKLSTGLPVEDRQRMALAFLMESLDQDSGGMGFPEVRVVQESWRRTGDTVELQVSFESPSWKKPCSLILQIDPATHLPQRCLVPSPDGSIRERLITYSSVTPAQLIAQSFPATMPIVDGAGSVVVADSTGTAESPGESVGGNSKGTEVTAEGPGTTGGGANQLAASLTGAASLGWSPIVASRLSNQDAVAAIDALLERLWREQKVTPAKRAADAELLRRIYLDLAGRTPTVIEVRNYLNDASPDRYPQLVDRLLASPDHATHLATVWRTFLLPEGVDLARFGGIPAFDKWLSGRFGNNVPYDQLVRELLLAEGRLSQSGPLLFYSAAKLDADQLAARTARVFLGMRLDCAQCHNDPFEPWTQQDFWSYAAFFARISRPQAALESVSTVMRVRDIDRGEVMMPDSKDPVPPKFLDGSQLDDSPASVARRKHLAMWLTGPENPYFARAAVNRVWAHLFGRGIVDPVDGFGKRNAPRSPELLDLLAAQFIGLDFDLRELFRTVALTKAYQLSSGAESDDPLRFDWFAQVHVKMLTAEQVYDCITVASMLGDSGSNNMLIERVGNSNRDEFLQQFKTLAGRPTEYQGGIPQALTLMNGTLISGATDLARGGLLKSLEAPFFTDDERIEVLYLATLSRRPSEGEWTLLREYVTNRDPDTSIREPLADILWALLNSAEFTMNH